jgi:hypothetical protein
MVASKHQAEDHSAVLSHITCLPAHMLTVGSYDFMIWHIHIPVRTGITVGLHVANYIDY